MKATTSTAFILLAISAGCAPDLDCEATLTCAIDRTYDASLEAGDASIDGNDVADGSSSVVRLDSSIPDALIEKPTNLPDATTDAFEGLVDAGGGPILTDSSPHDAPSTPLIDAPAVACAKTEKRCNDKCVAINEPTYGCSATECSASGCPAPVGGKLACEGSTCVVGTCDSGFKKCGDRCVSISDPTFGCSATSCTGCPIPDSGTLICQGNSCAIGSCGAGTKKCNDRCVPVDRNNGCSDGSRCTACGANETCTGTPSLCACIPEAVTVTCAGKACGSAKNNCSTVVGCPYTCLDPNMCGVGGVGVNACCIDDHTACNDKACGKAQNNCGEPVTCPDKCKGAQLCNVGGAGTNQCGYPIAPSCGLANVNCGPSANESCCTSLTVTNGTFKELYDSVGFNDATHSATVSTFRLDKYEVTVGRFRQFVNAVTGSEKYKPAVGSGKHTHLNGGKGLAMTGGGNEPGWTVDGNAYLFAAKSGWDTALNCYGDESTWSPNIANGEKRPLNCVSWYQAQAFCIWDGGFLPTLAEWNYAAAGGGEQRVYPWSATHGSEMIDPSYASYEEDVGTCLGDGQSACTVSDIVFVGTKPKGDGRFGQSDMAGNLSEWTLDWTDSLPSNCKDCALSTSGNNTRYAGGGAYRNTPPEVRASSIDSFVVTTGDSSVGFRCARSP